MTTKECMELIKACNGYSDVRKLAKKIKEEEDNEIKTYSDALMVIALIMLDKLKEA